MSQRAPGRRSGPCGGEKAFADSVGSRAGEAAQNGEEWAVERIDVGPRSVIGCKGCRLSGQGWPVSVRGSSEECGRMDDEGGWDG